MKLIRKITLFFILFSRLAGASMICDHVFSKSDSEILRSVARLQIMVQLDLLQNKVMAFEKLNLELSSLHKLIAKNPELNLIYQNFLKEELQIALKKINQDRKIKKSIEEKVKQKQIIFDQEYWTSKIRFNQIDPGRYDMWRALQPVTITRPFEMMATPVTQEMWARLVLLVSGFSLNPSQNIIGKGSVSLVLTEYTGSQTTINQIKPKHPVENISWDDVSFLIDKLNGLSKNRNPVIQSALEEIMPGHKLNDIYDFPTAAQWEYVATNRGRLNINPEHNLPDVSELQRLAWFANNSEGSTQEVALKAARLVENNDGSIKPFFDLEGNVFEMLKDTPGRNPGGTDPVVAEETIQRLSRGGDFLTQSDVNVMFKLVLINRTQSFSTQGFRLVRYRGL